MVKKTTNNSESASNLSSVSGRTVGVSHLSPNSSRFDNSMLHNSKVMGPLDGNSLLGVIVDRSSFDEDDELTTFGGSKDSQSMLLMHSRETSNGVVEGLPPHDFNMTGNSTGGVVMRNGKVRRKLRWKPRFGRKSSSTDNLSSNASVISTLTSKSTATSRSNSTTRSFLSHFSRRSGNSYHTFHSTETPVVTNKANRPKAPQTVMRPNYQDSFDAKHSTIDNEGTQRMMPSRRRGSFSSSSFSSKLDSVSETMVVSSLPDELNDAEGGGPMVPISPRSPLTEASPRSIDTFPVTKTYSNSNPSQKPVNRPSLSNGDTLPKPKRPPLFKRRLRNKMGSNNKDDGDSDVNTSTNYSSDGLGKPISPTETSETSTGGHTAPTASLSSSISLERENSVLPALSADEYEEDRRVELTTSKAPPSPVTGQKKEEEKKEDYLTGLDDLLFEEGAEENSVSPTVAGQSIQSGAAISIQSGYQSLGSGSSAAMSYNSAPSVLQGRRVPSTGRTRFGSPSLSLSGSPRKTTKDVSLTRDGSGSSSPSSQSNFSVQSLPTSHKRYGSPNNVNFVTDKAGGRHSGGRSTRSVDLDERAFLEAERNLRAIHEMAAEHLAHGEYEEAIEVFEEILRGQQVRYGQDHYRVGTALHNLGIVYLRKGDYKKAIEVCGRAVELRKEALVPNHPDVAVSLAQLGVAHLELKQYKAALEAFRDALHIRQNFLGPRHPKCSKILNNIGCALYSIEEFGEAKKAFEEALDIQRDSLRNLSSSEGAESDGALTNSLLLSSASTLCNIGSIRLRWGEFDEATIALDEALLIQQSVLGDDHPTVKSTVESLELVETAKYCAENPTSPFFLMKTAADTVCHSAAPSNVAQMLGFDAAALDALAPHQWFQNPCGPTMYAPETEYKKGRRSYSLSPKNTSIHDGSDSSSQAEDEDRHVSF